MVASRSPGCGLKLVGGQHVFRAPVLCVSSEAEVSFLKEMKLTWKQVAFQLLSGE